MNQISASFPSRRAVPGVPTFKGIVSLVAACIAGVTGAFAQDTTGTLSGRVSNAGTGAYLSNAEVRVAGTDRVVMTVAGGRYVILNVPAGEVSVRASYSGLDAASQTVTVEAGRSVTLDFELTSGQYEDIVELEAFVVAGEREGSARAIVDQRFSDNIRSVIAADAFGTVAEDNVGEFLKFVSGVAIDYNENDARTVNVRGLSAKYSTVSIDGNPVASADFNIGTGRTFQFEQVSLSTADSIDINKTPLADQSAASLAGTVNIRSRSAFDQRGRRISYNANLTLNEYIMTLGKTQGWDDKMRRKALPGGSLMFSDTLMDGRLGVVASINHTGAYIEQKVIAGLGRSFDTDPDNNATEVPRIASVNWQDGLKPTFRDSFMLNLDYRATDNLVLSLRTSLNKYDAPFHNRNWTFVANSATNDLAALSYGSMRTTAASATDANNSITVAGTNFRKYGETFSINPALAWQINENMKFDGSFAYSRSYQWYDAADEGFFNIVTARMRGVSWGFTSSPGSPALQTQQYAGTTGDTRSFFDLRNYDNNNAVQLADRDAKDQYWTLRGDLTVKLPNLALPTVLKVGVDSRLIVKDIDAWTRTWAMNVNPAGGGIDLSHYPDPYTPNPNKGQTFTDVNGQVGAPPSLDKWRLYDLFTTYNTDPFYLTTATQQPFFVDAGRAGNSLRNQLQGMRDFEEEILSAYAMATMTASEKLRFIAGLRMERTESKGRAFDDIGASAAAAASGTTNTNNFDYIIARFGTRNWKDQSYSDLFPSMQVRFAPNDRLVLRGAYYRSILRPDPQHLARSLSITEATETATMLIQTANPDLKPEYANNFDARVEFYFEPVGMIAAGVFYKSIDDIQVAQRREFESEDEVPQDVIDLGYDPADLVSERARFGTVFNGPKTSVKGFELEYAQQLSFLPGELKGLGVFANYTYSKPAQPFFFLGGSGVPKHVANGGLSYSGRQFAGKISMNWMGKRLLSSTGYTRNDETFVFTAMGTNAGALQYQAERMTIDLNLEYKFDRRATLFLNVANLLNEPTPRYQVHPDILIRHFDGGARYTIGIRGTF